MTLKDWLKKDDVTVAFSSAYFGFFSHTGFLAALIDNGVNPKRVTGSSAGAIVASLYAAGINIREIEKIIFATRKIDFWDPAFGFGLLRGHKFEKIIAQHIPDSARDFKYPLSISVLNLSKFTTEVFDIENIVTGVRASCALPILFHPVKIKNQWFCDGGFLDALGLASIKPDERVLSHSVVTSVNLNPIEYLQLKTHRRNPNFFELRLKNAVKVSPWSLEKDGPRAYKFAYEQTLKALEQTMN